MTTTTTNGNANRTAIMQKALSLVDEYGKALSSILNAQDLAAAAQDKCKRIEADTLIEVAAETKADGKPAFSNEAARAAETTRRLAALDGYREIADTLRELTITRQNAQNNAETARQAIGIYKAFLHGGDQ